MNYGKMCCRLMGGSQKSRQASTRHLQRPCSLEGKMPCRGKAWFPCTGSCKPDPWAGTLSWTTPRCWRLPVALADLPLLSRYYSYPPPLLYLHIFWTSHLLQPIIGQVGGGGGGGHVITQLQSTPHSVYHSHVILQSILPCSSQWAYCFASLSTMYLFSMYLFSQCTFQHSC